jgi:hypothetical protein
VVDCFDRAGEGAQWVLHAGCMLMSATALLDGKTEAHPPRSTWVISGNPCRW